MHFWKKLSLLSLRSFKGKKRAATQAVPPQAAPMPHGEREFRRFMEPGFDHNNEEDLGSMATLLQQASFAAEVFANSYSTPVAKKPTRYCGIMRQPEVPRPESAQPQPRPRTEVDEVGMILARSLSDLSRSSGRSSRRNCTT